MEEGKELDRSFGAAGSMEGFWVLLRDTVTHAEVGSPPAVDLQPDPRFLARD